MKTPWPVPFRLVVDHVYDGDPIMGIITADAGLGIGVTLGLDGELWAIRFYGINAPELTSSDPAVRAQAVACRDYLHQLVSPGDQLSVQSYSFDKYRQRIDGIPSTAGGVDLCAAMLAFGNGVEVLP